MSSPFLDLAAVIERGQAGVLATIVRGRGPAYRKPGASAVITADGKVKGVISGGCLELDLIESAVEVCRGAPARLHAYEMGGEEDLQWGTGSGCGGLVTVLLAGVERAVLELITREVRADRPVILATVIAGPLLGRRMAVTQSRETAGDLGDAAANEVAIQAAGLHLGPGPAWLGEPGVFVQTILPAPALLVIGAGDDAQPVVRMAHQAGFRVAVADHRPAWVTRERFPEAERLIVVREEEGVELPAARFTVVMTHQFYQDLAWLKRLLPGPAGYVGLLGARKRAEQLVGLLLQEAPGLARAVAKKLHAPVGLAIGADGPEEIAVSVVAELIAAKRE